MEILASRVLFRPKDYERSVAFYRDGIGLAIAREYLSLIHISEPTRLSLVSRMPSSA